MKSWLWILSFLISVACIVRNKPAREKFITFEQQGIFPDRATLVRKVHEEQWKIGYRFAKDCPDEYRRDEEMLKGLITAALRAWLQPLHDAFPTAQITDKFILVRQPDLVKKTSHLGLDEVDTRVNFMCKQGTSYADMGHGDAASQVYMYISVDGRNKMLPVLIHEIGHVFGLVDTYPAPIFPSTGGSLATRGTQPVGVMTAPHAVAPQGITEDDRRGIIWIYKRLYEGQPLKDCFFPEYIFEEDPAGCRPKHPLIFEIKYGIFGYLTDNARWILKDDPKIDVNAQDDEGLTALHHAVMRNREWVVKMLLEQADINPTLLDKQGHSPLELAEQGGNGEIIKLLRDHPLVSPPEEKKPEEKKVADEKEARPVDAKGKKAVTWGEMKRPSR